MAIYGAAEDALAAVGNSRILASALCLILASDDHLPPVALQELDLPFLGRERQDAEILVEAPDQDGPRELRFAARGPLVSYLAICTVESTDPVLRATLAVECEPSDMLVERAMNELRSRSPLPFRTDADAILRRAVLDAFDEHAVRMAERWAAAVSAHLAGSA
jgi:hypothetical protein